MKFLCEQCRTKYSIADEKVRHKVLKIRCKNCGNIIVIRDQTRESGEDETPELSGSAGRQAGASKILPLHGGASSLSAVKTDPAAASGTEEEWYLAVDGHQYGPMSFAELCSRVKRGEARSNNGEDGYVWRDGYEDWIEVANAPELKSFTPPPPPRSRSGVHSAVAATKEPSSSIARAAAPVIGPATPTVPAHPAARVGRPPRRSEPAAARASRITVTQPPVAVVPEFSAAESPLAVAARSIAEAESRAAPAAAAASAPTAAPAAPIQIEHSTPLIAAIQHLPAAFADAPPQPDLPAALRPHAPAARVPLSIKLAMIFGIVGAVVGVTLVVYFLWIAPQARKGEGVRIVAVGGEDGTKKPIAIPGSTEERNIDFPPTEVQRSRIHDRKPATDGRVTDRGGAAVEPNDGLTPEQRRLMALYKGGDQEAIVGEGGRTDWAGGPREVSASELAKVLRKNRGLLQACYDRALKRDQTLTGFKAEVEMIVGASGIVKDVKLDAGDASLSACLKQSIRRWVFQPVGADSTVSFPLIFAGS